MVLFATFCPDTQIAVAPALICLVAIRISVNSNATTATTTK